MPLVTTSDGCALFYSDWGDAKGRPVVLVHAWGLNSAMWNQQIPALLDAGHRCVVYDRRGHGRSDVPGSGYDLDTLADDLSCVVDHLDLADIVLVGHSMGASEVVRYMTRKGSGRVAGLALSAPTLPALCRTEDNPDGIDMALFEEAWRTMRQDIGLWLAQTSDQAYFGGRPESRRTSVPGRGGRSSTHPSRCCWPASAASSERISARSFGGWTYRRL